MGILKSKVVEETPAKRKSTDFSKLAPLKPGGAVGFVGYREGDKAGSSKTGKKSKKGSESDMDSDEEEDEKDPVTAKADEDESNDTTHLSPDDLRRQGDLAEGVRKIKVCSRTEYSLDLDADDSLVETSTLNGSHGRQHL